MDEHNRRNIIAVVTICPCASWLDKLLSLSLSVSAAALAAQEHCCCCFRLSMSQLVGQVVVLACLVARHRHHYHHLSLQLQSTQVVVVVVCPVAHCCHLSHRCSITITIAVYPCASYPSHHHHHCHLSHGSLSPSSLLLSACDSGCHRSLPLWLIVIIIVMMVGGDSWDWCWRWWHWLASVAVFVHLHVCDGRIAVVLALVVVEVDIGGVSIICALVVAGLSFSRWREQLNVQSIQARTHLCHLGHPEVPKMHPYRIVSDAEDWSNLQISVHALSGLSSWSWLCVIVY